MAQSFWSFHVTGWTLTVAGLLLAASVALSVWNLRRDAGGRMHRILEVLRSIVVLMILVTLFRPEYVRYIQRTDKPRLAVLSDGSGSMQTRDVVPEEGSVLSRREWIEQQLEAGFHESLNEHYEVIV